MEPTKYILTLRKEPPGELEPFMVGGCSMKRFFTVDLPDEYSFIPQSLIVGTPHFTIQSFGICRRNSLSDHPVWYPVTPEGVSKEIPLHGPRVWPGELLYLDVVNNLGTYRAFGAYFLGTLHYTPGPKEASDE